MTKLKRPPTSGTRHGNGAGWGGPAKGAGNGRPGKSDHRFTSSDQPSPEAKAAGKERRQEMLGVLEAIALDPDAPPAARVAAADHALDRIEGKPVAKAITAATSLEELVRASLKPAPADRPA